jgi:hypothetical protein
MSSLSDLATWSVSEFESVNASEIKIAPFYTHDNGGRPFRVQLTKGSELLIHKAKYYPPAYTRKPTYRELVWKTKILRFWKGFDSAEGAHGCSCLAHVEENLYICVCQSIFEFRTKEPIQFFAANLGNSLSYCNQSELSVHVDS